jgi:hypothetical protein
MANTKIEAPPAMAEVLAAAQAVKDRLVQVMPQPRVTMDGVLNEQDRRDRDRHWVISELCLTGVDGTAIEAAVPADEYGWAHTDLAQEVLTTASVDLDLDGTVTQASPERFQLRWVGTMP